jgi:hypothetical protein
LCVGDLPPCVYTVSQVATCSDCPDILRSAARAHAQVFASGRASAPRREAIMSPKLADAEHSRACAEIEKLRALLPDGCERRMLGNEHAFYQATPCMRRAALMDKFVEASGPSGKTAARDRRFIVRWLAFCSSHGICKPWPVGSVAFKAFVAHASSSSKGAKGGASVAHSLKLAAVHARDHFCLPVDLDAAILFNSIKPKQGDADSATAPSLACLAAWERLASDGASAAVRHACQVACLACWLSLRSVHCVRLSVLDSSNEDDIRLNISRDKDNSRNVWVGCEAAGLLGPFSWWPALMRESRSRGFLACACRFDSPCADTLSAGLLESAATSRSMECLFALAFAAAGVPKSSQNALRFTGHSPRHLLPCVAEVMMWHALLRDELGRWATGAANAKKVKCGPRYTVAANQALQVFLRRSLRQVMVAVFPMLSVAEWPEAAVPDFHAMSSLPEVMASPMFGPHGPGYIPGFGRVSV